MQLPENEKAIALLLMLKEILPIIFIILNGTQTFFFHLIFPENQPLFLSKESQTKTAFPTTWSFGTNPPRILNRPSCRDYRP